MGNESDIVDAICDATEVTSLEDGDFIAVVRQEDGQRKLRKTKKKVLVPPEAGLGNVTGPGSATDGNLAVFDGTTGKLLKDGGAPFSGDAADLTGGPLPALDGSALTGVTADPTPGVPRWLGPKRIYAVRQQTIAITSNPRAATGSITVDTLPVAGEQIVIDSETWVFSNTAINPFEILVSVVNTDDQAANIVMALGASAIVTAQATGSAVALTNVTPGAAGNGITFTTTSAHLTLGAFAGGSGGGNYTVTYDDVASDPIQFNDVAGDVQAALEAIPALTGKVTVTGDMPTSNIVLDDSIEVPLLFVVGENNLTDGAGEGAVDVYVSAENIVGTGTIYLVVRAMAAGEELLDIKIERIENFASGGTITFQDGALDYVWSIPTNNSSILIDQGASSLSNVGGSYTPAYDSSHLYGNSVALMAVQAGMTPADLPIRIRQDFNLYAAFAGVGGPGNTTGIVDVYICVATPASLI